MTKRTFNFNITMNTSVRGRGKWGDFLVALIPITWCCNILINSNFILRMIEWQNESSLFTIRIQGKQWYWVYKYDPNTAQAAISTPKNIGNNRWRVFSGQESYNADTYYQAIHLAAHLEFQDSYSKFTEKTETHKKNLNSMSLSVDKLAFSPNWYSNDYTLSSNRVTDYIDLEDDDSYIAGINTFYSHLESTKIINVPSTPYNGEYSDNPGLKPYSINLVDNQLTMYKLYYNQNLSSFLNIFNDFLNKNTSNYNAFYDYLQLDETTDVDSNNRHNTITQPFRILRGVLNKHVAEILQSENFILNRLTKPIFLNTKFSQSGEFLKEKELMPETLWGFRQKKYKRLKKFKFKAEVIYDPITFEVIGQKKINLSPNIDIAGVNLQNINISTNKRIEATDSKFKIRDRPTEENFNYRLSSKINRHRSELVPVTLARRLLRTKRTLVLPAHVNITVITNSYDVVHSWFVPGLGLKMDCVPGRSTHHTFYIDNIGFYYGQCAEICGRYHHHMPIRLCALPFEHFVVWWKSKGLARMNRTSEIKKNRFLNNEFSRPVTREKLIYRDN